MLIRKKEGPFGNEYRAQTSHRNLDKDGSKETVEPTRACRMRLKTRLGKLLLGMATSPALDDMITVHHTRVGRGKRGRYGQDRMWKMGSRIWRRTLI
jgi:hypothetical protein